MRIVTRRRALTNITAAAILAFAGTILNPTDVHAQQRDHKEMPRRDVMHDVYVHDRYPDHPVREYGYAGPVVVASVGPVYVAPVSPVAPVIVVARSYGYGYGGRFRR
jgi:hypothetical protein